MVELKLGKWNVYVFFVGVGFLLVWCIGVV